MTKKKILVVEDELVVGEDIALSLSNSGYDIAGIADSGEEALIIAEKTRPHLVVMDIRLNGVWDGVTTATEIRAKLDIPIIYLTAHSDAQTLERAKMTAPYSYLLKPFKEKELLANIKMALYRHDVESSEKDKLNRHDTSLEQLETG